jgi:hypothetical protein
LSVRIELQILSIGGFSFLDGHEASAHSALLEQSTGTGRTADLRWRGNRRYANLIGVLGGQLTIYFSVTTFFNTPFTTMTQDSDSGHRG